MNVKRKNASRVRQLPREQTAPLDRQFSDVQDTVTEIKAIGKKMNGVCLESAYQIGQILLRDMDELLHAAQIGEICRKDFWEQFSEAVGIHEKTLHNFMRFARDFSEAQVKQMIDHGISWSHVIQLLGIVSISSSEKWLQKIIENDLTVAALDDEITAKYGNRRKGSGKRAKIAPPKSLKVGMNQTVKTVRKFTDKLQQGLCCEEFDLVDTLLCGSPDELTEDIRKQVEELIPLFDYLDAEVGRIANALRRGLARIDDAVAQREEMEKEQQQQQDAESVVAKRHRSITLPTPVSADYAGTNAPVVQAPSA